jgi:membrane-associated phospholipid phosphatase
MHPITSPDGYGKRLVRIADHGRGFSIAMAEAAWRHRLLYAIALTSLTIAMAVGSVTGSMPDFSVLRTYGFYILVAFWIGGCGFAIFRLIWLAAVERNPSPTRAFCASFIQFFGDARRMADGTNAIAALMIFISGFAVLKGAIGIVSPFSWDSALADADRWLHFGHAPHEWLWPVLESPFAVFAINFAYNFWFVTLIATVFTAALARHDSALRHQFFISFMLVWLLGGFFIATGFSSAGPCYFSRIGLGTEYQPLMDALEHVNQTYAIWALSTQDMLWDGFTGASSGNIGISAFPSMHVASALLFAIYASRRSVYAGLLMWCFAAIVMIGSVALGWHYAVDGYAGTLITIAIWKAVGKALGRTSFADEANAVA